MCASRKSEACIDSIPVRNSSGCSIGHKFDQWEPGRARVLLPLPTVSGTTEMRQAHLALLIGSTWKETYNISICTCESKTKRVQIEMSN